MEINGVTVEVVKCEHAGCAVEPTAEEIRKAVTRAQDIRACPQWRCAYCGESVKATFYRIYHGTDGWSAMEMEIEPAISIRVQPQNAPEVPAHNGLHLRCVEKALPYLNGLEQKR